MATIACQQKPCLNRNYHYIDVNIGSEVKITRLKMMVLKKGFATHNVLGRYEILAYIIDGQGLPKKGQTSLSRS